MKYKIPILHRRHLLPGLVFLGLFLTQCSSRKVYPAFYYWRTVFDLSNTERAYLQKLGIKRLYVRYFDIDWNPHTQKAQSIAELQWRTKDLPALQVIPTVFITNRTLLNISYNSLKKLGNNIANKITKKSKGLQNIQINEIQLDCDWSGKTQERFFQLIEILKSKVKSKGITHISATIRLHQIKYYEKTGVPPVDRGMLMFYNMGSLDGKNTDNSILDLNIARKYLIKPGKYPLKLDVALPIYQWGVLIRRGKVLNLLSNLKNDTFVNGSFFRKKEKNQVEVIKSTYSNGIYLYKGDIIRLERITMQQLKQAARLLQRYIPNNPLNVAFYHLDEKHLKNYQPAGLQNIYQIF